MYSTTLSGKKKVWWALCDLMINLVSVQRAMKTEDNTEKSHISVERIYQDILTRLVLSPEPNKLEYFMVRLPGSERPGHFCDLRLSTALLADLHHRPSRKLVIPPSQIESLAAT